MRHSNDGNYQHYLLLSWTIMCSEAEKYFGAAFCFHLQGKNTVKH